MIGRVAGVREGVSSRTMKRLVLIAICATATFLCAGFGAHAAFAVEGKWRPGDTSMFPGIESVSRSAPVFAMGGPIAGRNRQTNEDLLQQILLAKSFSMNKSEALNAQPSAAGGAKDIVDTPIIPGLAHAAL